MFENAILILNGHLSLSVLRNDGLQIELQAAISVLQKAGEGE